MATKLPEVGEYKTIDSGTEDPEEEDADGNGDDEANATELETKPVGEDVA